MTPRPRSLGDEFLAHSPSLRSDPALHLLDLSAPEPFRTLPVKPPRSTNAAAGTTLLTCADWSFDEMDHPYEVKLDSDFALQILRLLDGLSKSKLLAYGTKRGRFEYQGPAIPEAGELGRRLAEALRLPFGVNDKVVWATSDVGTVIAMKLWD